MSVTDLIRQRGTPANPLSPQELVSRYQRMRAVSRKLNSEMVQRLGKEALHEGGRKLGLLRGNTFIFGSEDQTSILMDYCLYNLRRNGRTAVEQYCCDFPPAPAATKPLACARCSVRSIRYSA